ncbi:MULTISPECIES: peptidylprolyl isomerase [unclassified Methanosarcina]|uniref:FKBP-type peptidyl-prolyl cis-trans isomerase n=1 Tax=unclassified Methanosarcina TaxID=2644672 RepID=UPI0006160820|nr:MULTISPECIES: peptidylprolyl isomerase [unclassified Methanosarcina]AKB17848.1 Peptidyl-prolyl cis-trans isomerase [Methanosarcina sp. WWM596]AKB21204.1 Peptidyl-prolyl cis-trans isomerase [Methanosarcina sp. WH1]
MRAGRRETLIICVLLIGSILFGSGCAGSGDGNVVKTGNTIQVDYTGKLKDGTVFDTSIEEIAKEAGIYTEQKNYVPLTFKVGSGQLIKGFDEGVIGMKIGEEKTFTIPPEKAYGKYDEAKIQTISLEDLNLSVKPEVGQTFSSMYGNTFRVIDVNETHVTLDPNHELAGKTLIFDIKLISIE